MKVFAGTSNTEFADLVCKHLGCSRSNAELSKFSDGEIKLVINESVRNDNVFVIQSTGPSLTNTPNDNIMELSIFIDALKRGSARSVTAVIPYYGYQRQDRKDYSRAPISARVIATFLESLGVNRVIVFDLHAGQIQGFFSSCTPVDNLYVESYFIRYIHRYILGEEQCFVPLENIVIVSPDEGGMKRAVRISSKLKCSTATIYKDRRKPNEVHKMILMGDVQDRVAVIVDDIIDTAGTACKAAEVLFENGATKIYMLACHGILSGPAMERISHSHFTQVVITNTLEISEEKKENPKISVIDVSWYCAEAIRRSLIGKSLKELDDDPSVIRQWDD
ncbi:MAG: phosphoribosylpyrophosphate synthetase [Flammeovirgaceae bacterium]|nr:phosphoribosylpyrophosphate synthetase [Flammeovirgaceae bacterium]